VHTTSFGPNKDKHIDTYSTITGLCNTNNYIANHTGISYFNVSRDFGAHIKLVASSSNLCYSHTNVAYSHKWQDMGPNVITVNYSSIHSYIWLDSKT